MGKIRFTKKRGEEECSGKRQGFWDEREESVLLLVNLVLPHIVWGVKGLNRQMKRFILYVCVWIHSCFIINYGN